MSGRRVVVSLAGLSSIPFAFAAVLALGASLGVDMRAHRTAVYLLRGGEASSVADSPARNLFCIPPGNPGDYAVSVTPDDSVLPKLPFATGYTSNHSEQDEPTADEWVEH